MRKNEEDENRVSSVKNNKIFLLMISIILLSITATVVAQYGDGNEMEIAVGKLYEEKNVEIECKGGIALELTQSFLLDRNQRKSLAEEEIIVASAEQPREVSTRNAPPRNNRNNSATEYAHTKEPIIEPNIEQPQILPEFTYINARGMLSLINAERANHGLQPLIWSDSLTASARIRAREITVSFSHTRPDGRLWNTVGTSVNGENLAARQRTLEIAFRAWMESPSHRENILRPDFRSVGIVGLHSPNTEHTYYWVQLFGR